MKKKSLNIIVGLLMIGALIGVLALVKKNQDLRKDAYFAGTNLLLQPVEFGGDVGTLLPVQFWLETDGGAKVSSADVTVCHDDNLSTTDLLHRIVLNEDVLQELIVTEELPGLTEIGAKQCIRIVAIASPGTKPEDLKSGMIKLLTINFTAASAGRGEVLIQKDSVKIGGYNPAAGATDTALEVGTVTGATYNITETVVSVDWPVLNYKIQYAFVKPDYSKCYVPQDWPLQIIVLSEGVTKAYNDVVPSKVNRSGDFVTAEGSLILEGFDKTTNVAAFMKGPKHLQMKYAVDKQGTRYNKAGGELTLTKLVETSPIYDFTAYPILSGDIVGKNSDNSDGVVNGYDWTEVKKWVKVLETVDDGGYIKADLDGSCQVNSNDLYQLRLTLEEKQGELY